MRPEEKDFFTLVQDTLNAMRVGDYTVGIANDARAMDKTAFLVLSQGFKTEDQRLVCVGQLLSTILLKQIPETERAEIGKLQNKSPRKVIIDADQEYHFAVTRYEGGCCFFFKVPEGTKFDFDKADAELKEVRDMFMPKNMGNANASGLRVSIGPISHDDIGYFDNIVEVIMRFHRLDTGVELQNQTHESSAGLIFTFPRAVYENFIRNPEMIAAIPSGNKGGLTLPPPA